MENRLPSQMSGGQQQRASIARCLLAKPEVIFADEPTGALDQAAGKQVLEMLRNAVNQDGRTLVMVTHDPRVAAWADRVIFMVDGKVHSDLSHPTAEQITAELAKWEDGDVSGDRGFETPLRGPSAGLSLTKPTDGYRR
jgi:putative ABC transport system ATP-binding protein